MSRYDEFPTEPDSEWSNPADYEWDDSPSVSRLAVMHDTGKACAECFAEFTEANGTPSACDVCKNMGSELPRTKFPELNTEAHKAVARRRRKNKEKTQ